MIWPWLALFAGGFAFAVGCTESNVALVITGVCALVAGVVGIRPRP